MASLLYPDEEQSQAPLSLLQPPDDRPPVLQPDPRADALGTVYQQVMDAMEAQRRISAERGLWDDNTGMPTKAGLLDAIGQAGTAVALGTSAPGDAPPPGFTAYHGSPHQFDAFDLSKIGTGEGAQAYGHGMYLAENEAIARGYRDKLSTGPMDGLNNALTDFQPYNPNGPAPTVDNLRAMLSAHDNPALRDAASNDAVVRDLRTMLSGHDLNSNTWDDAAVKAASRLDTHFSNAAPAGHMYEVQVNADPERFLHWDKPLSEQHPDVQAAINSLADNSVPLTERMMSADRLKIPLTGQDVVSALSRDADLGAPEIAQKLKAAGIPGIRYLDAGSRGAGEGSYNSVIFDPKNMEIIRRYGLAGLMAGGGAAAIGGQQRQQQ
jgi:hypothetical protein